MPIRRHRLEMDWTGKKNTRERIGQPLTKVGKEGRKMLRQEKAKRAKKNKQQGSRLEKEVATIVHGERIPLSGAAKGFKGDVLMPIPNSYATILLECKSKASNNRIVLHAKDWLPKLKIDVDSNQSVVCGGLVFRFAQDKQHYYLFMSVSDAEKLNTFLAPHGTLLDIPVEVWYDASQKPNGHYRAAANFPRITTNSYLDTGAIARVSVALWNNSRFNATRETYAVGKEDYILMYLQDFVDRVYTLLEK